ncbi:hypothetical protein DD549_18805 [Shewanella algae]|nr:hypothetical protein DD549_18805 [Shewanella algae]
MILLGIGVFDEILKMMLLLVKRNTIIVITKIRVLKLLYLLMGLLVMVLPRGITFLANWVKI